jgi:membrane fusion protein
LSGRPLFRREIEQARAVSWLGRIVLIRPVSFSLLALCALLTAAALAAYFCAGHYTRKARLSGMLAPTEGVMRVIAQQPGVVTYVAVHEGDDVRQDATLLFITDPRAPAPHMSAEHALAERIAQRRSVLLEQRSTAVAAARTEVQAALRREQAFERETAQVALELGAQEERLATAQRNYDRTLDLHDIGFLSGMALDREAENELEQRSRLEALRRAGMALARERADQESEAILAAARLRAQLAAIDVQRAALEQEALERALQYRAVVAAPRGGRVGTVLVEPGQAVLPGTTLATILPAHATLEAVLYAPSRSMGFVKVGQEVLLRYLAYPHQKFGSHRAVVRAISANPVSAAELGIVPADGGREPLYRIRAALDAQSIDAYGRREALQSGMQVEADVMLDRRRLIEWVFEPLLSLAGRA